MYPELRTSEKLPKVAVSETDRKNTRPSQDKPNADTTKLRRISDRNDNRTSECVRSETNDENLGQAILCSASYKEGIPIDP